MMSQSAPSGGLQFVVTNTLRLSCAFVSGAAMKRREFISLIGGAALSISDEVIK